MPGTPARHVALSRCPDQKLLYATLRYSRDALLAISCSDAYGRAQRFPSRGGSCEAAHQTRRSRPTRANVLAHACADQPTQPGLAAVEFSSPAVA